MILGEEGSKISQIAEVPLVTSRGECAEPIIGGLNRCQSQKRYNKNGKELHFALSPSFRQREQDKRVSFYIKAKLALIEVELTIVRLMVEIPSEKGRKKKNRVKMAANTQSDPLPQCLSKQRPYRCYRDEANQ